MLIFVQYIHTMRGVDAWKYAYGIQINQKNDEQKYHLDLRINLGPVPMNQDYCF